MGLIDDIGDFIGDIDFDEPHEDRGFGFDSAVCDGCEHHQTDGIANTCGLCGCPTTEKAPMAQLGMPPVACPRLDAHEGGDHAQSSNSSDASH